MRLNHTQFFSVFCIWDKKRGLTVFRLRKKEIDELRFLNPNQGGLAITRNFKLYTPHRRFGILILYSLLVY